MKSPLQQIADPFLNDKDITLYIKRDDMLHLEISGNKFRKMKYNLEKIMQGNYNSVLTFGGAYSNHIYAVAAAGKEYGFRTIGIIRGEKYDTLNPTLMFATENGMEFEYISREEYKYRFQEKFQKYLKNKYGRFYTIPDGASNPEGIKGCTEIISEISINFDYITVGCGTGSTLAGIIAGLQGRSYAVGFPALKGGEYLKKEIEQMIRNFADRIYLNWHLETGYHFGGFAKYKMELIGFINSFREKTGIQLDPVYNGKMMFGVYDLIKKGVFPEGSVIIAIHTGGLQGIDGFNQRYGDLLKT